jgi:hypothetical protein
MRAHDGEDPGCAFLLEGGPKGAEDRRVPCGHPRRPGSSFCPQHHALCHVPAGSDAERRGIDEAEALARAVGGRLGRDWRAPPEPLLRRLDRISRVFYVQIVHVMFREERCPRRPRQKRNAASRR